MVVAPSSEALPEFRVRRLRPDDWPAVLALADRLLGFPMNRVIRVNRSHEGWVLEDAEARMLFVQLTRIETIGPHRFGLLGWALSEPQADRRAPGRAIQRFFDELHAGLRAAGCQRFLVGDIDGYSSPSWRLAHAGGYRRWTPTQQMRLLGWRWPAMFWRMSHFGVRTFVLMRPADPSASAPPTPGRGVLPACGVAALFGVGLIPLAMAGGVWGCGVWGGDIADVWRAPALLAGSVAAALHFAARALTQTVVARRRGLALEYRVWDSGLVTAVVCALAGVLVPGFSGAPYVRDNRYDYLADRGGFGSVRAAGVGVSLLLAGLALAALRLQLGAPLLATGVLLFGLGSGLTDCLPLGGPWSAGAVGAVRRRHPRLAWAFFGVWCALLALAVAHLM